MTDRQAQQLEAYLRLGSLGAAARELKMDRSNLRQTIRKLEAKGEVPWQSKADRPTHLRYGKSTVQLDGDGNVKQEWRRQYPDANAAKDFVDELCDKARGRFKIQPRKGNVANADLLYEIAIYDAHVGMYADEKETLDKPYDTSLAAKRMVSAVQDLAERAREPGKVVLTFGGDMIHADNRSNRTEHSGHALDVDTRYQRVIDYLIAASRDCVGIASEIAPEVEIVILRGNHSWHSEAWLARVLQAAYEECPGITINTDYSSRQAMRWGDCMLAWAHGDRINAQRWQGIISTEFPEMWGRTKYRHLKLGHVHHKKAIAPITIDEQSGLLVEFCEALCPSDAWHSESGYVGSQRGASAYEYHKQHGLLTRHFHPAQ